MRRKDREVTNMDEIMRIVEQAKILHLALFDSEYPYVLPLHYGYEFKEGSLVFYLHSAKEGHKLDLIRSNPNVCVELECDVELVSGGEAPCKYGAAFASVIGRGHAEVVCDVQEKIKALSLLMKHQTGREFTINDQMASTVEVIKVVVFDFTAKSRPKVRQIPDMTEKKKMLSQKLYDANYDADLIGERKTAKDLCYDFNQLRPSDEEKQQAVMKKLLGRTKGAFTIVSPFWCDYGYNIEIGENFFANHNTVILDCAKVIFGDNVFVAPNCGFYTAGHPIDSERRNEGLEYAYPIKVGSNVWIGAGVQVMSGVTIGSNVVTGGGSVVVGDIPDNCVALGNPCQVLRPITDEDKLKCWDR